ncbi:urease accessory protein UreF [Anianabacter salinae]|uniref:urease accessory protein UreF n=1 Tax=Anianabacter salinae TaxID=2851023 RepID=UPI00225DE228|nr:urease accessory UreF family protein [Anianabacter salinae]MBV0911491.1 urease accessory protein UreF [Anianabacter salinae]
MTADLLTLTQWLSPAFPVGAYAYSHGLEAAVLAGDVTDAASLQEWLGDVLALGAGRADATLLSAAHRGEDCGALSDTARALCASRERWAETMDQGRAFAAAAMATGDDIAAMPYPVAVGVAARRLSLATETVAALYLHGFTSTLVSAAVRFVPLGQSDGQGVLSRLHPVIEQVAAEAATAEVADIASAVFAADIAAMAHETLEVRIFRT